MANLEQRDALTERIYFCLLISNSECDVHSLNKCIIVCTCLLFKIDLKEFDNFYVFFNCNLIFSELLAQGGCII